MLKIRQSHDRLIFNMEIPIPGKDGLYVETGPWWFNIADFLHKVFMVRASYPTPCCVCVWLREILACPSTKHLFRLPMLCFSHLITPWWCHQMEAFSALLALCAGNSPVTGEFSPQRPVTRPALMFSLPCARINGWVDNRKAGDLRRHRVHYDVTVMHWGWD